MKKAPIILLAFANDRENSAQYLRALTIELNGIKQSLRNAERAGTVQVIEWYGATLADIINSFQDPEFAGRIKVFHYGGHANSYQLLLETQTGNVAATDAQGFANFLANQRSLELVFLNGCATKAQSDLLLNAGIPAVIATSTVINDEVAQRFALRFYRGLAAYQSINKSFLDAKYELEASLGTGNFRGFYWEGVENTQVPARLPWDMYPERGSEWFIPKPEIGEIPVGKVKIGNFVHLACDRQAHLDAFATAYSMEIKKPIRQPRVFILHGIREERHESFVTRCAVEQVGKNNTYIRPYEVKNWPVNGDQQYLLKTRLLETFEGLNWSSQIDVHQITGLDIIAHPFFATQKDIIIQHIIPAEEWAKTHKPLIEWYVNYFWNIQITDPSQPNVVVFLNVHYGEEPASSGGFFSGIGNLFSGKYTPEKIQKELETIQAQAKLSVVLPLLHSIEKHHIEDWTSTHQLNDLADFSGLSELLFPSGTKFVPMKKVETTLKAGVEQYKAKNL